ncbi:MAG: SGNH/GDSL hydrolase family protein [Candidatus Saccharimonadales bacterium]
MNTNPDALNVLCYGDSNTWGQKPDKSGRYGANVRWTGVLQQLLGNGYSIVEEGLGSRTTDLDYAPKPGRNGKTYLIPCLESNSPLDIVIIMLGTSDLKLEFSRSADGVAQAISGLVGTTREISKDRAGNPPQVILVSPAHIDSDAPRFSEFYTGLYDITSAQKSQELAATISVVAQKAGCQFVDAARVAVAGADGIHFNQESHAALARLLKPSIEKLNLNRS